MRRRTASLLRRMAQGLDPIETPRATTSSITFSVPEVTIDSAKIGREIAQAIDRYARATGRPIPFPTLPDPGRYR